MKTAKFKIFKGRKFWYWHLTAKNGEIVCQSEGYATKQMATKTVKKIQSIAAGAEIIYK